MVVLTGDQQQYLQNTGQTSFTGVGSGLVQPTAIPTATVSPAVTTPVPPQPIGLVNRTPQGPAPQTSLQTPLSSLPPTPTSGKGGMGVPAQPSQLSTGMSTTSALPTSLPFQRPNLVQRSSTDAINASVPPVRSGKGGGTPAQPTGVNSLFSPSYTPTVYDTGDAYSGSDYVDDFFNIGSGNTASLQALSTAIQPGAIVSANEEDTGPTDAEIQAPKPGEPLDYSNQDFSDGDSGDGDDGDGGGDDGGGDDDGGDDGDDE
jgi:hypothetical protein